MNCTVEVNCKPYVKRFIENNCGSPSNLRKLPELHDIFIHTLRKGSTRFDYKEIANYTSSVKIIISEDDLYRYGWELTKTGTVLFNRKAERLAKFVMRQFISLNRSLQISVADSIREFQERFGYSEDEWPYDSIKKDFDRHGKFHQYDVLTNFKQELQRILLDNLTDLGTISEDYELKP